MVSTILLLQKQADIAKTEKNFPSFNLLHQLWAKRNRTCDHEKYISDYFRKL